MRRLVIVSVFAALLAIGHFLGSAAAEPRRAAANEGTTDQTATLQGEDWKLPVVVMLIGGGARFRSIRLNVGDGGGGVENRSFDTGAYFDFGWHFVARPWGRRSAKRALQAMILQLDGGAGIGLTAEPGETGISLRTNTWRLLGELGYLYPLGRFQVGGLFGVGADVLRIDLNAVLPSSRILYVRLGPAVACWIVSDFLGLRFDFGLRFPWTLGDLSDSFGADSSAFGLDAALMLGGRLDGGFSYALRFGWEYYRMQFSGATMDVPSKGDGGDGTDYGLTLQLLVGWSL